MPPYRGYILCNTDNALCCITKYVMSKCRCLFDGMRDFRTSTRTKVFRFNQKFIKVLKCSAKFKYRPVGKIRLYWVWYTNPASYKSPAQWKPFSNGRYCFIQVTRCYMGMARQASSMIWNVIRTVIGWKPLIQRIRLHFVNMPPVRRRLSRTQVFLGGSFQGGGCRCQGWKCGVLWGCPPTPHSIGDPPNVPHFCCCQMIWWVVVRWVQRGVSIWGPLRYQYQ